MAEHEQTDIGALSLFLLDYTVALLAAGAHTDRCLRCVTRTAEAYGFQAALMVSQKNISMSLVDCREPAHRYTAMKRLSEARFNFSRIGLLSALSWRAVDDRLPLEALGREFRHIMGMGTRPAWLVTLCLAAANAAFCCLFGGDAVAMLLVFVATALGFLARRALAAVRVNHYGAVVLCAFFSSLLASAGLCFGWGGTPAVALSTSVLYLVPGVQIINSFMDLINGYALNCYQRGIDSLMSISSMALGLAFTLLALGALGESPAWSGTGAGAAGWPFLADIGQDALFAAVAALGFAMASTPARRALPLIAFVAALGHALRFTLQEAAAFTITPASFAAALIIGLLSVPLARHIKSPASSIAFPALLPLIPGMYAYNAVLALVRFMSAGEAEEAYLVDSIIAFFSNGLTTLFVVSALVIGILIPIQFFRRIHYTRSSVKFTPESA